MHGSKYIWGSFSRITIENIHPLSCVIVCLEELVRVSISVFSGGEEVSVVSNSLEADLPRYSHLSHRIYTAIIKIKGYTTKY